MADSRLVFVLTRGCRQRGRGIELTYWGWSQEGPVLLRFAEQRAVFFVEADTPTRDGVREASRYRTLAGAPADAVWFSDRRAMQREAERIRRTGRPTFEADVKPADRFLLERMITGGCRVQGRARARQGFTEYVDPELSPADVAPDLRVASFDVEAEGPDAALLSVAIVEGQVERVFVRGAGPALPGVYYLDDEPAVLRAFLAHVAARDPDVLIGWNVIEFDMAFLQARCRLHGIPFRLGRGGEIARVVKGSERAPSVAMVPGRTVLDGMATMRAATWSFERWSLEYVAQHVLGRGKAIDSAPDGDRLEAILRMYRQDLPRFIEYNLQDCRLVRDLFEAVNLLAFAIERQRLTGVTMDRRAGAVAAFDYLYLPRLHRAGRVAPTTHHPSEPLASPGGYVMDAEPGLFENVLVLDFKSLYPSIIRTFLVDPLGLAVADDDAVEGYEGARFHRELHILPGLIEGLWAARDRAKARGDTVLQRAIKIQMNSFYGVLGTPACRFFDPRLASSITRRGHEVLRKARAFIEAAGQRVIYGDTDSLFVLAGRAHSEASSLALGRRLAEDLNQHVRAELRRDHDLESRLELELECCFSRLLIPTMRRSQVGSKKRYAGMSGGQLVIRGLEAVRTDWTPLARTFQRELLRRVFAGEPYAAWIRELAERLYRGELDRELVYRKRLRQDVDAYVRNVPPHVAAARQLGHKVRVVEYVITTRGPQPVLRRTAPLNYNHYLHNQLAPAAGVVLPLLGDDFMKLAARQLSLF